MSERDLDRNPKKKGCNADDMKAVDCECLQRTQGMVISIPGGAASVRADAAC